MHAYTFDPTKHRQFLYCQNVDSFQLARFAYYLNKQSVSHQAASSIFVRDLSIGSFSYDANIDQSLERLSRSNADVIIVTATHNRADHLLSLYKSIQSQQFNGRIGWVIIENGSTDGTLEQLKQWSKDNPSIIYLAYKDAFGYASPARNRGLALIQLALRHSYKKQFIWMVDSDDIIHNEFAVRELYKTARPESTMTHGYAMIRYEDEHGNLVTENTIPRNIGAGFPVVPSLKDEFEMGPQVLSALMPTACIPHFYYPDEFTMEDDTLNQRIMAWSKVHGSRIRSIDFPCLTKTFHYRSMSGANDQVGDPEIRVQLGPKIVTGIRAQAVMGLLHVRDFFAREDI